MDAELTRSGFVLDPYVLRVILARRRSACSSARCPGSHATMATALLVPVTFFMPPVPAVACIVTATAMAIFAGDIPSCLLRVPGTPASAAYTDEAYPMTKRGQGELALGAGLVFSVIGGLFGTAAVLILAAPALAEVALKFSSYEYFWLVLLGLLCAVFIARANPLKGIVSLLLGLLSPASGSTTRRGSRFTFGNAEFIGGLTLIPMMIGMFAVSEVLRSVGA